MTLEGAPGGSAGSNLGNLLARPDVIEDRICGGLRYVVLAAPDAAHRLVAPADDAAGLYRLTIEPDACAGLRIGAAARLLGHLGFMMRSNGELLRPTPFQERRLKLMLGILDRLEAADGSPATVRTIAAELVYRNMGDHSAIDWKGSSQRRQTQRLIMEAKALMHGGYRTLLLGKTLKGWG